MEGKFSDGASFADLYKKLKANIFDTGNKKEAEDFNAKVQKQWCARHNIEHPQHVETEDINYADPHFPIDLLLRKKKEELQYYDNAKKGRLSTAHGEPDLLDKVMLQYFYSCLKE